MVTKQGLYLVNEDGKNTLMYNGKRISTKLAGTLRQFGLHINGATLEVDGSVVGKTSVTPKIEMVGNDVYFGDVQLVEKNECVNITLENYNTLIAGGSVAGYKTYSPTTVYNIVENPDTTEVVTYNKVGNMLVFSGGGSMSEDASGIYNSVNGELDENTEDLAETIDNPNCPNVHVRYFNPVIAVGDAITIDYFVDTRTMSSIQYSTLNDTFTLIVKTPYGTVKQTTYAGFYQVTLPAFTESGIKWFSVRCIDSNGISSEEQFFDVMVKAPHTEVVYNMTAEDLDEFEYNGNTYQIVPNDNTVATAFSNKAALSAFFAKVKAGGADRVVMYNNLSENDGEGTVYWVDYHGVFGTQTYYMCEVSEETITSVTQVTENEVPYSWTHSTNKAPKVGDECKTTDSVYYYVVNTSVSSKHIVFPDYFTVDLNGSTIAATQSFDLGSGNIILFDSNTDTHLVNGSVKGNADGFDFLTSRKRCGTSTEWLGVVRMSASKYCSFENLDVSGSEGFDACLETKATNYGNWLSQAGLTGNASINLETGESITKTNMVRSGAFSVSGGEIISFGRNGYNMYLDMGPEREFFYCFYASNGDYIGFIKSHFYHLARVPSGATSVKLVGYGKIAAENDTEDTDWKPSTNRGTLMLFRPQLCLNILIRNCSWHDTRTTAITNLTARGVLLENCTYKNIAIGDPNGGVVTPLLADLEDSWQWASNLYLRNNKWITSNGHKEFKAYYANSFEFVNNSGFDFIDGGGISSGVFEGNTISGMTINRNRFCYFPSVVYRNNRMSWLTVSWGANNNWTHHQAERIVAMSDSKITTQCRYADLLLKRCRNGNVIIN